MSTYVERVTDALHCGDASVVARLEQEMLQAAARSLPGSVEQLTLNSLLSLITRSRLALPVADKWLLIPAFIQSRGLMRHHIDSFDHFVEVLMPAIVATFGEVFLIGSLWNLSHQENKN
jgi:hypothetical protein